MAHKPWVPSLFLKIYNHKVYILQILKMLNLSNDFRKIGEKTIYAVNYHRHVWLMSAKQ